MTNDVFLERIKQAELKTYSWITKSENNVLIIPTTELANTKHIKSDILFKKFKTDLLTKFFIIALLLAFFIGVFMSSFHNINLHPEKIIVGYLFIILLILSALNQFFFTKSLNFTIRIDSAGIYINEILYEWKDIYVTAIMEKGSGRRNDYLLITLNDMKTYTIYNLVNFHHFNGFSNVLSNYIEYFKSLSNLKQKSE